MKYRDLNPQMSWPPKEDDLKSIRTIDYIPHLLVFSGKSLERESCFTERTISEKESFAQDIAFFFCYERGRRENSKKRVISFCCKGAV